MKLSIITPSYNQAAFLPRTLESIAAQTHPEIEHLIQDPGSTDGTLEILERYAAGNPRVSVQVEKDGGQADAINRGIQRATGELLCWLNTDDSYDAPDVIAAVVAVFRERPEIDVVYGRGDFVSPSGETLRNAFIHTDPANLVHQLQRSVGILQPGLFFRASLIRRAGLLDTQMQCAFDHDLWTRFIAAGAKFHFLDRKLVNATYHEDAKSSRLRRAQLVESGKVSKRYYNFESAEWITRVAEFDLTGRNQIVERKGEATPEQRAWAERIAQARFRQSNGSNDARFAIISSPQLSPYAQTRKLAAASGLTSVNRVIATTFDDAYLQQGLTLIRSVRAFEGTVTPIVVYDLNLSDESKRAIAAFVNVHLAPYPHDAVSSFPGFLYPKNYSYKCVAMLDAGRFVEDGGPILWIDAGVAPISSLEPIYELVKKDGVFFVDHDDKADWPFYNGSFCHPRASETLNATSSELFGEHLCSCLVGYTKNGPFQKLFEEADRYARIEDAVIWSKHPGVSTTEDDHVTPRRSHSRLSQELAGRPQVLKTLPPSQSAYVLGYFGHRQDQTILSILAARYQAPIQSATRYCRSDDASSKVSKLNWESKSSWQQVEISEEIPAHIDGAVTYHHRGTYSRTHEREFEDGGERKLEKTLPPFHELTLAATADRPRSLYFPDESTSQGLAIADHIRRRESLGLELFVLRAPVIAALPEELRALSCVWNFDDLRQHAPGLFPIDSTPETDAANLADLIGFSPLPDPVPFLDDDLCAVRFALPVTSRDETAAARLIRGSHLLEILEASPSASEELSSGWTIATHRDVATESLDIANLCWKDKITALDLLRLELSPDRRNLLDTVPWERLKPRGIICHLAELRGAELREFLRDTTDLLARHGYTTYLVRDDPARGLRIHPEYRRITRVEGHFSYRGNWRTLLAFKTDPGIHALAGAFDEGFTVSPPDHAAVVVVPEYPREADVQVSELAVALLLANPRAGKSLISVGADRKVLQLPFFAQGWNVLACVPNAAERSYLSEKYKRELANGILLLESRTASDKIDPIVSTLPLADLMREHGLRSVGILHLHSTGRDLEALRGFPWQESSPSVVLCTGVPNPELLGYLESLGYRVFISEWHPTLQQGVAQQWKTLREGPGEALAQISWGVTLAVRWDIENVAATFLDQINRRQVTPEVQVKEAEPPAEPAEPQEPPEEVPPPPTTEAKKEPVREFRAGTKAVLSYLFRKKKPVCIAALSVIVLGTVPFLLFAGPLSASLWLLTGVSLLLGFLSLYRLDQAEFALRSALGDVALLKEKVADLRARTLSVENKTASLEKKTATLDSRARKLESSTGSLDRNVSVLKDRVNVGVDSLEERSESLEYQSEVARAGIDSLTEHLNRLRSLPVAQPDPSQPRSRVLSELSLRRLAQWGERLGVGLDHDGLLHFANRIRELEERSIGRLDLEMETALLQVLLAKSIAGKQESLRSLEIGGLFGIGQAILYPCCLGDFVTVHATCHEPQLGHVLPNGRDPYTKQFVNRRVIERNLLAAGAEPAEIHFVDSLDSMRGSKFDLITIGSSLNEAELDQLLEILPLHLSPQGYLLLSHGKEMPGMATIHRDLAGTVLRRD